MSTSQTVRILALALAFLVFRETKAQGLEEHILQFRVSGITTGMLEKQCYETLQGFDPDMVVAIDTPNDVVKVKTMHELPTQDMVMALRQLGLSADLDMKREEEHASPATH